MAHFRAQFTWSTVTVDFPLIPTNEPVQVDTGPPFKMEVLMRIDILKMYKLIGPDGL